MRAKGMTMMRMPLTVWSWFITAILGCWRSAYYCPQEFFC